LAAAVKTLICLFAIDRMTTSKSALTIFRPAINNAQRA
jgi:hypothetical protein